MTERLTPVVPDLVLRRKRNGRCVYSRAAKRSLVEAALQPGISVARLALDHAVNANLLRKWIRAYEAEHGVAAGGGKVAALLPVVSTEAPVSAGSARTPMPEPAIEIVVDGVLVRLRGNVDAQQLRTVMDCLAHRK
jgi:transposase